MQRYRSAVLSLPAILVMACCLPAAATTVYKAIDKNGVVSYSDAVPENATNVQTMTFDAAIPEVSEVEQQRLQDMRETTDRMAADRMTREKHRAEMRQLQAQKPPQTPADHPEYAEPRHYPSGGYYSYPVRRPWWRHQRPRPEHPIARPPIRTPMVRPLTGNNYPASLIRRRYNPKVRAAFRK